MNPETLPEAPLLNAEWLARPAELRQCAICGSEMVELRSPALAPLQILPPSATPQPGVVARNVAVCPRCDAKDVTDRRSSDDEEDMA